MVYDMEETKELEGGYFLIILPANWNDFLKEYIEWAGIDDKEKKDKTLRRLRTNIALSAFQEAIREILEHIDAIAPKKYDYFVKKIQFERCCRGS